MKRLLLVLGVCAVSLSMLAGEGWAAVLESPRDGATLSGLGFISGWKCDAGEMTVRLDRDDPIPLAAEQPRADTRPICGTTDNGFMTQLNWALLGDGKHTAVVYEDGVEFARATFEVMTTGEEFLTGVTAHCSVPDFPAPGENVLLEWEESTQHFELTRVSSSRVDGQRIFTGEAAIIDADTLTLGEERIRFIGIDAPERHQLCLDADGMCYRCGQIATEVLKERIGDDSMVSCYLEPDRDSYGRALGVCFGLDGTDLNGWLVANGHALAYTYYSSRYVPQEGIATAAQRGIWDGQFVVPSQWRRGERLEACQGDATVSG